MRLVVFIVVVVGLLLGYHQINEHSAVSKELKAPTELKVSEEAKPQDERPSLDSLGNHSMSGE